uniref:MalT-like TPR region domain-containing protein n=1 Tax=Leersia perrieri TaxID=77586 RepID=A0A0D9W341_9ORYZ
MAVYRRVLHLRCLPHFQPPAALSSPLLTPSRSFVSSSSSAPSVEPQPPPLSVLPSGSVRNGSSGRWWDRQFFSTVGAVLVGQAVGLGATRNEQAEENATSLQRIEDGSVVSNEHTRNLDEAEKFFQAALHEAKEGFGLRDPHVASALNNLAEFYRLKKEYEKAELLVGTALHSLGICYHLQRKFALAQTCYEIEGRVMGVGHPEYASTMYLLGKVLSQQGKDAEALIEESIRVLEEAGLGDSPTCLQRMRYLSTGWDSLDTTNAAELLTLTLQTIGKLKESEELLERCLEVRKKILSEDHLQVAVTLVHLARLTMLNFVSDKKEDSDLSRSKLVRARLLVNDSMRIAEETLYDSREDLNKLKNGRTSDRDKIAAASALEQDLYPVEQAVNKCISLYKEPHLRKLVSKALKNEYIRCLRRLTGIVQSNFAGSEALTLQGLLAEAQQIIEELGDASN